MHFMLKTLNVLFCGSKSSSKGTLTELWARFSVICFSNVLKTFAHKCYEYIVHGRFKKKKKNFVESSYNFNFYVYFKIIERNVSLKFA